MSKKVEDDPNEEYTFKEDTNDEAYPVRRSNPIGGIVSKFSKQRVLIAIVGVVVIVFVLLRVLGALEHRRAEDSNITAVKKTPKIKVNHKAMGAKIHEIGGHHQQELKTVRSEVGKASRSLYNIQRSIHQINGEIRRLDSAVALQMQRSEAIEAARTRKIQKKARALYRVYSVIPNRAWLFGPRGKTITVSVGSALPQVGTVVEIDPVSGTVYTNMGAKIEFALTDQ